MLKVGVSNFINAWESMGYVCKLIMLFTNNCIMPNSIDGLKNFANLKLVVPTLKLFVANLQLLKRWLPWLFQYKPSLVMEETLFIVSWVLAVSCDSCPFAWSSGFIHQNQLIKQKKKKMFTKNSNGCKDFKSTIISENFMQMDVKI